MVETCCDKDIATHAFALRLVDQDKNDPNVKQIYLTRITSWVIHDHILCMLWSVGLWKDKLLVPSNWSEHKITPIGSWATSSHFRDSASWEKASSLSCGSSKWVAVVCARMTDLEKQAVNNNVARTLTTRAYIWMRGLEVQESRQFFAKRVPVHKLFIPRLNLFSWWVHKYRWASAHTWTVLIVNKNRRVERLEWQIYSVLLH